MSASCPLSPKSRLLVSNFQSTLTNHPIESGLTRLLSLQASSNNFAELADFRRGHQFEVSNAALNRHSPKASAIYGSIPITMHCAAVAQTEPWFGLSSMFKGKNGPEFVDPPFSRSLNDALKWLDRRAAGLRAAITTLAQTRAPTCTYLKHACRRDLSQRKFPEDSLNHSHGMPWLKIAASSPKQP